jgi:hypothetical protein
MHEQVVFQMARDEDICREELFADRKQYHSSWSCLYSLFGINP